MIVVLPMCTISPFSKGAKAHFDDAIIVIATAYKCDNLRIVLILFLSKLKLCNNLKKILQDIATALLPFGLQYWHGFSLRASLVQ